MPAKPAVDPINNWPQKPLAELLRPKKIEDFVGQEHILGQDTSLSLAFSAQKIHSMILWGPPGVGKTSLARLLAQSFDYHFIALSAVLAGVKDIRSAVEEAEDFHRLGKKTILFVDEIHRFNKSQQDALLPFVESGLLTFIGATTENPSFEVNSALLSRAQIYVLKPLETADLKRLLNRIPEVTNHPLEISDEAFLLIASHADGDARRFLNIIDQALSSQLTEEKYQIHSSLVEKLLQTRSRRFDKYGEHFYDQISALHKSVRGSHPDAALYWLCRILDGGADPIYLGRRLIRMAWEDIGLADPRAMQITLDAIQTYERLGSPEGELALGEAVIYLSIAAKSNAAYQAFNAARAFVASDSSRDVPLHLRNAPTQLMQQMGYGQDYRYAHDEPHGYAAAESYLPSGLSIPQWYAPTDRGLEIQIKEKMALLKKLDDQAQKKK
jgi:putative ATPase